ncbi:hypothetical protein [Brucella grignonensis]|uniref:Putative membrane protein n=1 Tax=Brucella grignonensis TaxID=94627 RepID=A0A256FUP8_9HYPH|nr:hypothetical protein [Brucella grignonensis]OYR18543.1 putative membrane protein [Brucella grignonensis]
MLNLLKNRVAYLSLSFALLMGSLPLISRGTTGGPEYLWWIGLAALCAGAAIPPVQRLFFSTK